MRLFDAIERYDMAPKTESGASFPFLNTSAQPAFAKVRMLLESWFANYPVEHQADLLGRFRSSDDYNHAASFFELFLHQLLLQLDCKVVIHPELPIADARPDFHVVSSTGDEFYLEAAAVMEYSNSERAAHTRYRLLLDGLNAVRSPNFFLDITGRELPKRNVRIREIQNEVATWLNGLDYELVKSQATAQDWKALPRLVYRDDNMWIELRALPKGPKMRGKQGVRTVGFQGGGMRWVNVSGRIKKTLLRKAHTYGEMNVPYVIAINVMDPKLDREDLVEALFGSERIPVLFRNGKAEAGEPYRGADGFWRDSIGARKKGVSAILVGAPILPWNIPNADLRLVLNPWTQRPYNSALCRLPRLVAEPPYLRWLDGESLSSIFGIYPDWPGTAFPRNQ